MAGKRVAKPPMPLGKISGKHRTEIQSAKKRVKQQHDKHIIASHRYFLKDVVKPQTQARCKRKQNPDRHKIKI